MAAHGRFRGRGWWTACAAVVALTALAVGSGESGRGTAVVAGPTASAAPPASPPPGSGSQGDRGDQGVVAVFRPSVPVSMDELQALWQFVRWRARYIRGAAVHVALGPDSITVVGDTAQREALATLADTLTVSFRPVIADEHVNGGALPDPADAREADAEKAFLAVDCSDSTTFPTPAGAGEYAVGCAGYRLLLGPAGAMGSDVVGATAKDRGQGAYEIDVEFTARGEAGMTALDQAMARNGVTMALLWDDVVLAEIVGPGPLHGAVLRMGTVDEAKAHELVEMFTLAERGVSLDLASVTANTQQA